MEKNIMYGVKRNAFSEIYNNLINDVEYTHKTYAGIDVAICYDKMDGNIYFRNMPESGYSKIKLTRSNLRDVLENVFQDSPEFFIEHYQTRKAIY